MLLAKATVIATMALLVGILATSASVLLSHAALAERGLPPGEFTAGMGWNLVGVAVNYVLMALIAASITILARTFIVTLVVLVPLVLGLTISLLGVVPALKFLPDLAGIQLLTDYPGVGLLDPVTGGIVMATWTLLLTGASGVAFCRRDTNG